MKPTPLFLALFLTCFAPLATGQGLPVVGPPTPLAGDLAVGPAGGVEQFPAIAAGASGHLAAWADHRSGFENLTTGVGCRDVYAQLVDANGVPSSTLPFRVAGGLGRKRDVQVAWNGAHWLVTWRSDLPTTFSKAAALFAARVDPQGVVLDDPPIVVRGYQWSSTFAYALGSNGNTWAVVTQGSSGSENEANVEAHLVQPDGTPQLVTSSLFPTTSLLLKFRLCWSGSQYLLTWDDSGVRGRRLSASLALLGSLISVAPSGSSDASAASNGTDFLVAFADTNSGSTNYRTVSATGSLGTITNVTPSGFLPNNQPRVAWNGNGYTLVWWQGYYDPSSLLYARISAAGALLDLDGIPFGQGVAPSWPVVASLGDGNAQVIWVDKVTTPPHVGDVLGTRITAAGVQPQTMVSASAPRQGFADLAAGPEEYLSVFTSERAGSVAIVAQRVGANGLALDAEPIELGSKDTYGHPSAAWNGQHYLVVWHDLLDTSAETDDVVLARRLAADGTPIDPVPFQVLQGSDPDVAAVGGTFLVAARFALTTQLFHIQGVRVDAGGSVIDAPPLSIGGNFARWPSVASFGDRWLVAWQRNPTHDNTSSFAHARVVFADGSLATSWSLGGGQRPAAAASANVGLVAWGGGDLHAQLLSPAGSLVGGVFVASNAAESQLDASVAWNGAEFLLAWEDLRNISAFFDDRHDIYATRVSEAGAVLDPAGIAIATSSDHEQMPAVAGRDGAALIAFGDQRPGAPHATVRTTIVSVGGAFESYCTAGTSASGCTALLSAAGQPSASASSGFDLSAAGVEGAKDGLFFFGANGRQANPWGNGSSHQCVAPPVTRGALLPGLGTVGLCDGAFSQDLNALWAAKPAKNPGAGATVQAQLWYRDPLNTSNQTTSLSDAVEFTLQP